MGIKINQIFKIFPNKKKGGQLMHSSSPRHEVSQVSMTEMEQAGNGYRASLNLHYWTEL